MNGILKNLPTPEILITDDVGEFIFKTFEKLIKENNILLVFANVGDHMVQQWCINGARGEFR